MTLDEKKSAFNKTLFTWHKKGYRDMPWRRTHDPYCILVSEVMLQQTQVDRVRTKYAEFLHSFPTVFALASAPLADVLRVWSGLGYNRRAKYLHECAKQVVAIFDGKFPRDFETLKSLPGIGLSTAAAVRAFAFDADEPMIDTNIRRILSRVFFRTHIPSDKELFAFAVSLIPKGEGRMWNYAMLDLGATLCTARRHFPECPLASLHGKVGDFTYKKPQKKFAGSRRQVRGQILKLLTKGGVLRVRDLPFTLGREEEEVRSIVRDLLDERLVSVRRGSVMLPHE